MAVINIAPLDHTWERVRALAQIARALLAGRIVCLLMALVWAALASAPPVLLGLLVGFGAWQLFLLFRWRTMGVLLLSHPGVLALDGLLGFLLLALGGPMSALLLVVGSGALLTGLCLGRRGAFYFGPLLVAGWWVVYTSDPVPERTLAVADIFLALIIVPALLVGLLGAGVSIRDATIDSAEAERAIRAQIRVAGVAEERARLAREMHDSLVKSLHGIALMADALPGHVAASPEKAGALATKISTLIRQASKESRDLILAMRRAPAGADLADVIRRTADRWSTVAGRECELAVEDDVRLPTESCYELVAILNEALENIHRHTPTDTHAEVSLSLRNGWVELEVRDDGGGGVSTSKDGHVVEPSGHFGLVGMKERAARVGGQVTVKERPDEGVVVQARMPAALAEDDFDE